MVSLRYDCNLQVEFASVVVINKCDLVTPQHLARVRSVVRALNAEAKVNHPPSRFYVISVPFLTSMCNLDHFIPYLDV